MRAAWDEATPAENKPFHVYAASKTEGERAAWKWVKENQPGFTFNSVLPNLGVRQMHIEILETLLKYQQVGRILAPEIPGSTMGWVRDLLKNDRSIMDFLPSRESNFLLPSCQQA